MTGMLSEGFLVSLQIFALTLLGSLPLGMLVAFARMSRFKPLALLARLYISIMRGTPLMLQMFAIYFVPYYVFGIRLTTDSKWYATVVAFIVNYAAYFAEIYRSGIQSIPRGQHEAAEVLGYSRAQTFVRIVLPQVVKRIMPAMTNEVITLVKRHVARLLHRRHRDVHRGKAARGEPGLHGPLRHRCRVLLGLQPAHRLRRRAHREKAELLP